MSFKNKVIIITGASSGIGADCARHLAKLGGKVVIVGRNEKRLNKVAEEIKNNGSPAPLVIVADITKDSQRIIDETIKILGRLDVLVNNAGVAKWDNVTDMKISDFDHIFNTNVRSAIILTNLSIPHLEKTKGNIVNVSSAVSLTIIPNFTSYSISKVALDHYTKHCALELAPKGIRVNSINPAVIKTSIFGAMGMTSDETEKLFDNMKGNHPIGRLGEVSDTSEAIAYLASETSSFLTGVLLPVDGGFLLSGH